MAIPLNYDSWSSSWKITHLVQMTILRCMMDMQGNSESWGDIVGRDFQAFLCHFQMSSRLYSLAKLSLSSNSIFPQKKVSDRSIFTWLQKAGILGKGGNILLRG